MTFGEFVESVPRLTKQEIVLLRSMYAARGCWITTTSMIRDMWGDIASDVDLVDAGQHNVYVIVNRIRSKLAGTEWRIEKAKPDRSAIGYRLVHR